MDALLLSRLQFATTIIYHFFFVPLTLGLSVLIAVMESLYVKTGNDVYKRMAQFWGKLFLINFALGVVTGLVQEFQFGMNWSAYSRFVGSVFGAPLAIETLAAFFMESTFLGVWVFGWEQLNKKLHLAAIWLVVLASYLSAFWIMVANAFMQDPTGYAIHNGRAEMTNFLALLTNPSLWVQFPHVAVGGLVTGAFFVVGFSAYHLLRRKGDVDFFRRSARIGMIAALISGILVVGTGHIQGQYLVREQPMKMAAAEALWNSADPAPFSLFKVANEQQHKDIYAVEVPDLLSFLAYDSFTGKVDGINQLQAQYQHQYGPGNYIPSVVTIYWSFRLMVGVGSLLALFAAVGLFLMWKKPFEKMRWFLWMLVAATILPYVGNTAGWLMTEMGRQPWLVFGLLKTAAGVSPGVTVGMLLATLIGFVLLYGGLAVVDAFLLVKFGLGEPDDDEHSLEDVPAEVDGSLAQAY
ncbi:MAG TPA: cytochrome ubiquinol oxidase subunit I [Ktedonobacteraceae bacterium]|nr:cytochrome ubiquinol oxidase subunit I [Ktedonobacteraceae bacterium]